MISVIAGMAPSLHLQKSISGSIDIVYAEKQKQSEPSIIDGTPTFIDRYKACFRTQLRPLYLGIHVEELHHR